MNTKLVTKRIGSMAEAAICAGEWNVVGNEKITPVVFIPERNSCELYLTIPEGFFSLVTKYDRYIGIWAAGFHIAKPWEKVSHMVTSQYIVYDTPVKECPTSDNVMVEVDVSVVFHVKEFEDDVKDFVYKLGPERLESMLKAFQEEAVRTMARQKKYSSIYDLMDTEELILPAKVAAKDEAEAGITGKLVGEMEAEAVTMPGGDIEMAEQKSAGRYDINTDLDGDGKIAASEQLENAKRDLNGRLGAYGVKVFSITITNVLLPPEFRHQMEEATTFDSKNIRAAAEQKFNLLVIHDTEKRAMAEQALVEELQESVSKNAQRVAHELKITKLYQAGTDRIVADIKEKEHADVLLVKSESALKVAQVDKSKDIELANIKAEAGAEVVRIRTDMNAFVIQERAKCKEEVATNQAATLKCQADAEKVAASKLSSKREYTAKMSNLRVLKNLSNNDRVAVSGTNKDSVVAQMLAAKNSSVALGLGQF